MRPKTTIACHISTYINMYYILIAIFVPDISPQVSEIEEKIGKRDYIKIKILYSNRNHKQIKRHSLDGRTYLPMIHLIKG